MGSLEGHIEWGLMGGRGGFGELPSKLSLGFKELEITLAILVSFLSLEILKLLTSFPSLRTLRNSRELTAEISSFGTSELALYFLAASSILITADPSHSTATLDLSEGVSGVVKHKLRSLEIDLSELVDRGLVEEVEGIVKPRERILKLLRISG